MEEDLFMKKMTCPVCGTDFQSPKVRRSKYFVSKVDTDFCTYYKRENPLYYNVHICPSCGYGYTEKFPPPSDVSKEEIMNHFSKFNLDFSGPRSINLALLAYWRAFDCALYQNAKKILLAGLMLHIAWLYRFQEDAESEVKCLTESLNYYNEAFEKDSDSGNPAMTLYVMGEINRRLGKDREAILCFTSIINDKKIRDAGIIRMARERWQDMRGTSQTLF